MIQEGFKFEGLAEQDFLEEGVQVTRQTLSDRTFRIVGGVELAAFPQLRHGSIGNTVRQDCTSGEVQKLAEGRLRLERILMGKKSSVFKRRVKISMSLFQGNQ